MNEAVIRELAPHGELRVGLNMLNFLLVTGRGDAGQPTGVSPDMGAEIARRLGVPVRYVEYPSPGAVADAAAADEWDIANIGAEPQRAEQIAFTAAYCEIEATYLVPAGSPLSSIADVDRPGVRIAVMGRAAYGLWLERNLRHAELVRADSIDASFYRFIEDGCDALAGLRPRLITDVDRVDGARILDGGFMAVQQAVGTHRRNEAAAQWLAAFVEEAKASGFIADAIAKHDVRGLTVAPPA